MTSSHFVTLDPLLDATKTLLFELYFEIREISGREERKKKREERKEKGSNVKSSSWHRRICR